VKVAVQFVSVLPNEVDALSEGSASTQALKASLAPSVDVILALMRFALYLLIGEQG
jgi:hypothetical protein